MAIDSAKEFFAVLEKSKLLDDKQLADAQKDTADCENPTESARTLVRQGVVTRWQAGQLLAGRSTFFLGKYKLIELLGRGGMGNVFLAQHITMNRRVALKIIAKRIGKDRASLERFFAEARAIAGLDHPNIVQAYSVDNEGDRHYIVMEFIDGRNLSQIVEEDGPLDFARAADYIQQAADGLAHAHDRNMIHCDIKPSNLLVNEQGTVKILDMGLARLGSDHGSDNGSNNGSAHYGGENAGEDQSDEHILGSVDYLAPEQALKTADFDHRADLYSLGCTLHFLLTGKPPFDKGLLHERLMKHQTQEPPSILEQRADTPTELVDLCQRMMAKKADERPQSATEISETLAKWRSPLLTAKPAAPRIKPASGVDDSAATVLPSINVDVQPKAKPTSAKPTSAKPTPAVAATGQEKQATGAKGFLATKQQKLIAAAAGTVVAVLLLAVTIAMIVGSDPKSDDDSHARTEQTETTDGGDGLIEEPSVEDELEDFDRPDIVATARAEDPDLDIEPGESADPEEEQPEEPEPRGDPLPEEAEKPAEPAVVVEPGDDPNETPEPEQPDQPKPDPETPKPDPPKPKDPLRDLVESIDLPVVGIGDSQPASMAPISLGKLHVEEEQPVDVELIGGDNAIKGSRLFTLHREENGTGWLISLDSPTRSGDPPPGIPVARVRLDGQALALEFIEGEELIRANHLRNCALRIRVDGKPHTVSLGTAQPAEPLVVNLDTATARVIVPADWLPETDSLRLQITELEGPFSKHTFEQTDTAPMKEKVLIVLADVKLPTVTMATSFDVTSRSIKVELAAMFQFGEEAPRPLRARDAAQMTNQALAQHQQLQFGLNAIPGKDKQRRQLVESQLKAIGAVIEKLQNLGHFYQTIHNTGKVHFRLFSVVDDQEIDLFQTKAP
ncbi:MAG: protein kinase [Thermoguttaceae bacterium]